MMRTSPFSQCQRLAERSLLADILRRRSSPSREKSGVSGESGEEAEEGAAPWASGDAAMESRAARTAFW